MGLIDDGAITITAADIDEGTASNALNELIKAYCKMLWKSVDFEDTVRFSAKADVLLTLCRARKAYFVE